MEFAAFGKRSSVVLLCDARGKKVSGWQVKQFFAFYHDVRMVLLKTFHENPREPGACRCEELHTLCDQR